MIDRYDDLMLGFYAGTPPAWIPETTRAMYMRESLRRRCELGFVLVAEFPCTMLAGRGLLDEDFAQRVYAAWPATRSVASDVKTGLYLALTAVLDSLGEVLDSLGDRAAVVRDLCHYEALHVRGLRTAIAAACVPGLDGTEVYRFDHAVTESHARLRVYAAAGGPALFVRTYPFTFRTTYIARDPSGAISDVTATFAPERH